MNERYAKLLENGRILLLHHRNAGRYYKMNAAFLTIFLGLSIRNYQTNSAVFISDRLGKLYISVITMGLVGLFFFGNRHIKNLYLDLNGKDVILETYTCFGLIEGREKVLKIRNLQGNRIFLTPRMNLY